MASGEPVELLAPARDVGCGRAAIDAGADAVYIGPDRFGARHKAGNSLEDIAGLVAHAHRYRARVYATVNTLLHDAELPAAQALIHQLWELGIDAVIIQDLGLLELDLPPVPLFASTQLDSVEPAKVRFLQELGFDRVILARELSLDEIRAVRTATSVRLEVFVHGALCVSYSGRCSASFTLGGRSANRGSCAQPCRLPWTLRDADGAVLAERQHLLSLRDLDRSAHLGELVDLGVGSLKIEGRLKDERYVRNVVGHYRRALDAVLDARDRPRASSGRVELGFEPDPSRSFHRGSTSYFMTGRERGMSTPHSPKSTGRPLGTVTSLRQDWVQVSGADELRAGDGLCFVGVDGVFRGTAVLRTRGGDAQVADPTGMAPGVAVSRNRDRDFEKGLDRAQGRRWIGLSITLDQGPDGSVLRGHDEDGVRVELSLPGDGEPPRDPLRAAAVAQAQLSKLGDTEFGVLSIQIDPAAPPHLRRSAWNELRRELVARLRQARIDDLPRPTASARPSAPAAAPWARLDYRGNVINQQARALLERCGVAEIEPGVEAGTEITSRPVMTSRYCLRFELGLCPSLQSAGPAQLPWTIEDERGRRLELRFDCGRCEMQVIAP